MKNILLLSLFLLSINSSEAGIYKVEISNKEKGFEIDYDKFRPTGEVQVDRYNYYCEGACDGQLEKELNTNPQKVREKHLKDLETGSNHKWLQEYKESTSENARKLNMQYQQMKEYVSETGQVFSIIDLLLKYEKLILSQETNSFKLNGREATDVLYRLIKKDHTYTIEVFTAEDAKKMASSLKLD